MVIVRANEYKTAADVAKISDGKFQITKRSHTPEEISEISYKASWNQQSTIFIIASTLGIPGMMFPGVFFPMGGMQDLVPFVFIGVPTLMISGVQYWSKEQPKKVKKLIAPYLPAVKSWLDNRGIEVSNSTTDYIALSMLEKRTVTFKSKGSLKKNMLLRFNDSGHWDIVPYSKPKKSKTQAETFTASPTHTPLATVSTAQPTTVEEADFHTNISLLAVHNLNPEQQHVVDRAKAEAERITAAVSTLKQLKYSSYLDKLKESFALLNDELNDLIFQLQEEELDKLNISQNLIAERKHKTPLQLKK